MNKETRLSVKYKKGGCFFYFELEDCVKCNQAQYHEFFLNTESCKAVKYGKSQNFHTNFLSQYIDFF